MNGEDYETTNDDSWLEQQNEDALRSREEADFRRGDPRYEEDEVEEVADES